MELLRLTQQRQEPIVAAKSQVSSSEFHRRQSYTYNLPLFCGVRLLLLVQTINIHKFGGSVYIPLQTKRPAASVHLLLEMPLLIHTDQRTNFESNFESKLMVDLSCTVHWKDNDNMQLLMEWLRDSIRLWKPNSSDTTKGIGSTCPFLLMA